MTTLEIKDLGVHLGSKEVLRNLTLTIPSGSFAALLGPSGCGKTTLLRTIAGLVRPSSGAIRFGKQLVSVSSLVLPPHKRNIGYLPQEGGLFPHLSVGENVGFALSKNVGEVDRKLVIEEMLELVGLSGYAARKPHQLSGGQQTRVALARALAIRPAIVLLDEPFSNLDHALRAEVSGEVVSLLKKSKTTSLMVTHDREDALVSADLIALMRDGQVVQSGTPESVYMDPVSADIAESTGDILELPARRLMKNRAKLLSPLHSLSGKTSGELEVGSILIRPEEIRVHEKKADLPKAKITQIHYYGHDAVLELALPGYSKEIKVRVTGPLKFEVGKSVALEHVGPIRWVSKKPTGE
ncbi:MAG: ABC transporter ATP-binding protein [Candidatus Nanopelagicaceae bacterium]|nr:ABC transporter ATP-binding protein [Candidatus Nanopelagicaceae bacterium]